MKISLTDIKSFMYFILKFFFLKWQKQLPILSNIVSRFFLVQFFYRKICSHNYRRHNWKVFETARAAKKAGHGRLSQGSSRLGVESCESASVSARSSLYMSDGESGLSDGGYGGDLESLYG